MVIGNKSIKDRVRKTTKRAALRPPILPLKYVLAQGIAIISVVKEITGSIGAHAIKINSYKIIVSEASGGYGVSGSMKSAVHIIVSINR